MRKLCLWFWLLLLALMMLVAKGGAVRLLSPGVEGGELGYHAGIGNVSETGAFSIVCSGALISRTWVLSAAHCFSYPQRSVVLGETDQSKLDGTEQVFGIRAIVKHAKSQYSSDVALNDLALVLINGIAMMTGHVHPISLPRMPDEPAPPSDYAVVSGWGTAQAELRGSTSRSSRSSKLKTANLLLMPIEACRNSMANFNPDSYICTGPLMGSRRPGKGSTHFEGGCPLLCSTIGPAQPPWNNTSSDDDSQNNGESYLTRRNTLCGIVAMWYNHGAQQGAMPVAHTKVSSYLHWIEDVVKDFTETSSVEPKLGTVIRSTKFDYAIEGYPFLGIVAPHRIQVGSSVISCVTVLLRDNLAVTVAGCIVPQAQMNRCTSVSFALDNKGNRAAQVIPIRDVRLFKEDELLGIMSSASNSARSRKTRQDAPMDPASVVLITLSWNVILSSRAHPVNLPTGYDFTGMRGTLVSLTYTGSQHAAIEMEVEVVEFSQCPPELAMNNRLDYRTGLCAKFTKVSAPLAKKPLHYLKGSALLCHPQEGSPFLCGILPQTVTRKPITGARNQPFEPPPEPKERRNNQQDEQAAVTRDQDEPASRTSSDHQPTSHRTEPSASESTPAEVGESSLFHHKPPHSKQAHSLPSTSDSSSSKPGYYSYLTKSQLTSLQNNKNETSKSENESFAYGGNGRGGGAWGSGGSKQMDITNDGHTGVSAECSPSNMNNRNPFFSRWKRQAVDVGQPAGKGDNFTPFLKFGDGSWESSSAASIPSSTSSPPTSTNSSEEETSDEEDADEDGTSKDPSSKDGATSTDSSDSASSSSTQSSTTKDTRLTLQPLDGQYADRDLALETMLIYQNVSSSSPPPPEQKVKPASVPVIFESSSATQKQSQCDSKTTEGISNEVVLQSGDEGTSHDHLAAEKTEERSSPRQKAAKEVDEVVVQSGIRRTGVVQGPTTKPNWAQRREEDNDIVVKSSPAERGEGSPASTTNKPGFSHKRTSSKNKGVKIVIESPKPTDATTIRPVFTEEGAPEETKFVDLTANFVDDKTAGETKRTIFPRQPAKERKWAVKTAGYMPDAVKTEERAQAAKRGGYSNAEENSPENRPGGVQSSSALDEWHPSAGHRAHGTYFQGTAAANELHQRNQLHPSHRQDDVDQMSPRNRAKWMNLDALDRISHTPKRNNHQKPDAPYARAGWIVFRKIVVPDLATEDFEKGLYSNRLLSTLGNLNFEHHTQSNPCRD